MTTPPAPIYDKAHFIAKFSAIPEEKWRVGMGEWKTGVTCAYGHCLCDNDYTEAHRLAALIGSAGLINDGGDPRYPQPTPRARILAALGDLT